MRKPYFRPWFYDFLLPSVIVGIVFLLIGFFLLTVITECGILLILFSIVLFLPAYWFYIKKPQIQKRENEETIKRQEEESKERVRKAELEKIRYQKELRNKYGDLFVNIVETIKAFKPLLPYYENELAYHIDLARWLEPKYPMLKVEYQLGSARPDIVIEDIAIEIKGPTTEEGLQSIADKCLRYHHHFKRMIVVLFNIRTKTNRFFTEWEEGLKKHFPDVMVIKK